MYSPKISEDLIPIIYTNAKSEKKWLATSVKYYELISQESFHNSIAKRKTCFWYWNYKSFFNELLKLLPPLCLSHNQQFEKKAKIKTVKIFWMTHKRVPLLSQVWQLVFYSFWDILQGWSPWALRWIYFQYCFGV